MCLPLTPCLLYPLCIYPLAQQNSRVTRKIRCGGPGWHDKSATIKGNPNPKNNTTSYDSCCSSRSRGYFLCSLSSSPPRQRSIMPRIPAVSPATGERPPPNFVHTVDGNFVDCHGRTLLFRGVNLSGSSKAPLGQPSYLLDGFWESAEAGGNSFISRPLNLDDGSADVHLARLRGWGFNILRYPITWEALEHEGPTTMILWTILFAYCANAKNMASKYTWILIKIFGLGIAVALEHLTGRSPHVA
ncbi:hypothetical protein BGY98DRAFT_617665 [Russula aff. rugulosa BPL654]|nr:hypothetical protein BGY98DRAFT_617665 [Russula aff. rugulosa BPL654]